MRITNINILSESVNHNNNKKDQEKDQEDEKDEKEKELTNKFLIEMKGDVENGIESVIKCKWLIIVTCCVFVTLLSWEIVGDEEGWERSYWILLMGVGIVIEIFFIDYLKENILKLILKL